MFNFLPCMKQHPNTTPPKVLFILKQREVLYENESEADGNYSYGVLHSGLFNSANFMNTMLKDQGFESNIVHVVDNNGIDREVTKYKPDVVIVEAFWVVPEKFDVLTKLHPNVKWVIRNHSKTPFLANEGIAFGWIMEYSQRKNVYISSNSPDTNREIIGLLMAKHGWTKQEASARCPFLPNYYPIDPINLPVVKHPDNEIHISCFGAIRPLKNHMIQAVAAIMFADSIGKKLYFHINGNRVEGNGNSILKNLRQMFDHLPHDLVEHAWAPHDEFLKTVASIDVGLQVSFTETFNIVAADHIKVGVPVVVSKEIDWVSPGFYADPTNADEIAHVLKETYFASRRPWAKKLLLSYTLQRTKMYNKHTIRCWKSVLYKM